jgi:hypothetical protein
MRAEHRLSEAPPFSGSYATEDVTFLLKPVALAPTPVADKERLIQSGRRHYSEMIAPEALPAPAYLALYAAAERRNRGRLAQDVANLAGQLAERASGREIVIASLARAGTPIGVLLLRQLLRLGVPAFHYSISIIRDRGIDEQALRYIAARHDPADVIFVDGWTGKGAIAGELRRSLAGAALGFRPTLAVIADPAGEADLAASAEDYLIASGLLNAVVSGLVSRTILSMETVGPGDFHACVFYPQWRAQDLSRAFADSVSALAVTLTREPLPDHQARRPGLRAGCEAMIADVATRAGVADRNRIKPGIAEATRAFLRRVPDRLFLRDPDDPDVAHLIHLAGMAEVAVERLRHDSAYRAVAVIERAGDA